MVKKRIDLFLLNLLKQGMNPTQISKEFNIPKQNINYYIRKFKDKGIIKKIGYGVYEVKDFTSTYLKSSKKIRGHAFIWTIQTNKKFKWIELLKQNKINYKLIRNVTPRIIINNNKIWLGKKTITIYDNRSFFGTDAIESRKYAVVGISELLDKLKKLLNINFKFNFKAAKEHFGMIKNELARQHNRKGEKLIIKEYGKEWLWIDDSESLGELETNKLIISKQVQDWWNNHKKHNFKVTPEFILKTMNGIQQNQLIFAENMKSHISAIKKLGNAVNRLDRTIKNNKLKNKPKKNEQKTLFEF